MGKLIIFFLFVGAMVGAFYYWQSALHGQLPSWGNLYNGSSDEKAMAEGVALMTNVWRRERVLPELRTEETLCPYVDRYVRELAKTGSHESFEKMVSENTIVLQVSFDKVAETSGYVTSPSNIVQIWSEDYEDRQILQDDTLTHRCVRCYQKYCAQIYIRQK